MSDTRCALAPLACNIQPLSKTLSGGWRQGRYWQGYCWQGQVRQGGQVKRVSLQPLVATTRGGEAMMMCGTCSREDRAPSIYKPCHVPVCQHQLNSVCHVLQVVKVSSLTFAFALVLP